MKKFYAVATMAVLLCLTGLVMSGTAFARCVDNGDGTVTDNSAGLMWQQDTAGYMNWNAAMSYAYGLSPGGHSGWRLPERNELLGLYNSPCKIMMSVESSYYWSSTTFANDTGYAWLVGFSSGGVNRGYKSGSYYVRAVRAGQ